MKVNRITNHIFDNTTKEGLIWRKELLTDLVNRSKPSSKTYKEYVVRIKELEWLISKCKVSENE